MNTIVAVLLAGLGMLAPAASAAESVNWQVTVAAQEEIVSQQWQSFSANASMSGSGGVKNYVPPQGTTRIDITVQLKSPTGCNQYGDSFSGIPLNYPYYAVWYTYLGGTSHKLQVFGGNVGGALLRESAFDMYCPNGYRQMTATFDSLVTTTQLLNRSASTSGNLSGGPGELKSAPWQVTLVPTSGGTLKNFGASVSGDNPRVALNLAVNPDHVSGTVTAQFPSCVPSSEVCDGRDNDCDGAVDEDLGTLSCGIGQCANTAPACVNGTPNMCTPRSPGVEVCDGIDNDCDGTPDDGLGSMSCGVGACVNSVAACVGGQPQTCTPLPAKVEVCDKIDNDCNGVVDNGCPPGIIHVLDKATTDPNPPPGLLKMPERLEDKVFPGRQKQE